MVADDEEDPDFEPTDSESETSESSHGTAAYDYAIPSTSTAPPPVVRGCGKGGRRRSRGHAQH